MRLEFMETPIVVYMQCEASAVPVLASIGPALGNTLCVGFATFKISSHSSRVIAVSVGFVYQTTYQGATLLLLYIN